jgi:uncharacterized protein YeeX (DUF496 family)
MVNVIINNETYELTDEPYHGIVRKVRKMQKAMLIDLLSRFKDELDDSMKIEDALAMIANKHPDEIIEYSEREEDFIVITTISLATNKMWTIEDFDTVPIGEMDKIFQQCKDILGGDVNRFFRGYATNTQEAPKELKLKKK